MLRIGTVTRVVIALAALGAIGCGTTSSGGGGGTTTLRGPRIDPCPSTNELRLGRVCWSPVGSRWHVTTLAPGGEYAFDVELLAAGRLRATDHPAATPGTDEWFVDGNTLRLFLGGRYVEYRADVTNGTVMIGEATNVRGDTWEWRADRVQDEGGCAPSEAPIGEACFSYAGTRWTVHPASGAEYWIELLPGGRVITSRAGDVNAEDDTWEQSGTTLTLRLDGGAIAITGTVSDDLASITGTGFRADAIATYPPPMH